MEQDVTPHEHKTFSKDRLYTVVYQTTKEGKPISYSRLYKINFEHLKNIKALVDKYYGYGGIGYDGDNKLYFGQIMKLLHIDQSTLKQLLLMMASCKKLIYKDGDRWKTLYDKPLILLQQKAKHIDKKYYGRKTPIYVLPFERQYWSEDG